jgi:hypothetical protein
LVRIEDKGEECPHAVCDKEWNRIIYSCPRWIGGKTNIGYKIPSENRFLEE